MNHECESPPCDGAVRRDHAVRRPHRQDRFPAVVALWTGESERVRAGALPSRGPLLAGLLGRLRRRRADAAPSAARGDTVRGPLLRYAGEAGVVVRGPVTGRRYHFTREVAVLRVAAQDAHILLRSRLFSPVPDTGG